MRVSQAELSTMKILDIFDLTQLMNLMMIVILIMVDPNDKYLFCPSIIMSKKKKHLLTSTHLSYGSSSSDII